MKKYFLLIKIIILAVFLYTESVYCQANNDIVRISKVRVTGAKTISKKEIKKYMETDFPSLKPWIENPEFDEELLKNDLERIQKLYANHGYYSAQVNYRIEYNYEKNKVTIRIKINEGKSVILKKLSINIEEKIKEEIKEKILKSIPLKAEKTFSEKGYEETKSIILRILSNRGYPGAKIAGEASVNRNDYWAEASFTIDPGSLYRFGPTIVKGNKKVKTYIITREVTYKEGEIYSLTEINETQSNLFQLRLFGSVQIETEFNEKEKIAKVIIKVKEKNFGSVKLGVGYGTEDEFRGQIKWTQRNFIGWGERLEASGKASSITKKVETRLIYPYIIGKDSEISDTLKYEKDDLPGYSAEGFLNTITIGKELKKYLNVFGSFNISFSHVGEEAIKDQKDDYFLTYFSLGLERDKRDNILNPTGGTRFTIILEPSSTALGSDVDYLKSTVELSGFKEIYKVVLAAKITIGVIEPFGSTTTLEIPVFKRFFAGGSTSMRGFPFQKLGPLDENEDPIGGDSLLLGSFESRFSIYKELGGVVFLDIGNVFLKEFHYNLRELKYASGLGLRYNTPVGPIRLDFAYTLNPEPGIKRYQFWVNIGQTF